MTITRALAVAIIGIVTFIAQSVGADLPPSREASADRRSLGGGGQVGPSSRSRSVADGVYTGEQARRGRDQYRKRCVLCHLDNGQGQTAVPVIPGESLEREGDAEAPPIAGEAFLKKWNGQTARALFERLASTMPVGGAGSLSPQEYADVLSYMFELNKLPAGARELTPARDELEQITIGR